MPASLTGSRLSPAQRWLALVTALVSLASMGVEFAVVLLATRDNVGPWLGSLRYFSYFTILSNLAVTAVMLNALAGRGGWLAQPAVRGAVALYIGVTGVIYAVLLAHTWNPQGLQWLADRGLHYVVPALYVAWWTWTAPHGVLGWRHLPAWLLFPLVYLVWTVLRGAWVGEYPYPFVDVASLGLSRVMLNSVGMLVLFVVAGTGLLVLDRVLARRQVSPA